MAGRRLVKLGAVVAALALAFVAAQPVAAHAANTENTDFALTISAGYPVGTTEHTFVRSKIDNTPSYAIASMYSSGALVGVAGINGYTLNYTNRTINNYAYFRAVNQHSSIRNTVNEHNEYLAWLWLYKDTGAPSSTATYVHGEWSPDSSAVFTVINYDF